MDFLANGLVGDREPRVDDVKTLGSVPLKAELPVNLSNVGLAPLFLGTDAKQNVYRITVCSRTNAGYFTSGL